MKQFDVVKVQKPKKNVFDLSHERKMSLNMGDLIPIMLEEVVPGDSFRVNSEIFIRLAPMLAPIMHRANVYTHYFFVPSRILWNEFEDFITGGREGTSTPNMPKLWINGTTKAKFVKGSLADYFGIPPTDGKTCNAAPLGITQLPFRAYQKIYNEYYRDQNVTAEVSIPEGSTDITTVTADLTALTTMRKRAWEKDYFTSALPWAQRGAPVQIPIEMSPQYSEYTIAKEVNASAPPSAAGTLTQPGISGSGYVQSEDGGLDPNVRLENLDDPQTDFNLTVSDFRRVLKIQEWLEKSARVGSRYIEQILAHFGVKSSDARLQRPEYLGGGKNPIIISEVLNTTGTEDAPQGDMTGHGIAVGNTNRFTKSFEEHGYIIGIMSVIPRTAYQQGIEKLWLKDDKFDFFWPEFAHIGEQEVLNKELYMDYDDSFNSMDAAFGYQMRYAEYKFRQSVVAGDMRDELNFWHMGRIFTSAPALNATFIECDATHRIFAVTDPNEHKLYAQIYNSVKAMRSMPYFGTPKI